VASLGRSGRLNGGVARLKRALSSNGFRLGLALAISALTLYLALRQVDMAQVRSVFLQVDWRYAALGVLSGVIGIGFKIGRWKLLLQEPDDNSSGAFSSPPGWQPVSTSFLSAQLINNFFPLRVGEVSRVAVVGGAGSGYAFVAGTIAIEKTFDLAAFAALFGLTLFTLPAVGWLGGLSPWLELLGLLVLVGALLIASQQKRLAGWLPVWLGWLPGGLDAWMLRHARSALSSFGALRRPGRLLQLAGLTAVIWWLAWWTNQLALQALGLSLPWGAALLILVALQVGISLPSLPGRVGVFEYVCILALQGYGIDPATALSYGILLHVVVYIPLIAAGLPSLWMLPVGHVRQSG
jgi:uncharacterized membrane protein YbhN (UPF0104 family)